MDNTREPAGHLSAIIGIGLLLIGLVVFGVVQQKAWSHQAELTKRFEACMESAPFKQSLKVPRPEAVLTDEQLQTTLTPLIRCSKKQVYRPSGMAKPWCLGRSSTKTRLNLQANAMASWASISLNNN